ncbi:hypothetical protein GCM10011376_06740 [Nocardioides flavus (ex Wang et al. 2016)]|uniref:Uncharacterized protein n=1 Tax=Nocardioides flavus (ex Wang et al. 2016) TaxID=2058780 RepID=A0ABQ3HJ06_9ACTN|nr:hypothetical protein [Nocardioides flavus (ex Wang et al. 2016)]GHE15979.1 hypothetical protein GCM10011376_06740 [Nocardioides flavus (ex Wang et al. 2016)]
MLEPADDVQAHHCVPLICPVCSELDRTMPGAAVADTEVPMFALLRGTFGLPLDNSAWWPEGVPRTGFAPPTVELLERTLRALRTLPAATIAG